MFHGSLVALVTPMDESGAIDFEQLRQLVEFHLDAGTDGIVVTGTTGESAALNYKEKIMVMRHIVEQVNNRIPVIAGTYATSTKDAIELTHSAMDTGVDACLIMTPAYVKPTQEGLLLHHQAIAKQVAIPQILYNVPARTCCDLLPQTVAQLAEVSNIIGIKEATGSTRRLKEILACCAGRIDVYSGDDATACELMLLGAKGVISVAANIAPVLFKKMCHAALAKDYASALALDKQLSDLYTYLSLETNPIPCKWALLEKGLISAGIRLPLTPLSDCYHQDACDIIENLQ